MGKKNATILVTDPEIAADLQNQALVDDDELPADRFILDGVDVSREPHFGVSEVAKFFFARSAHWVRWAEEKGFFVIDGEIGCIHGKIVPVLDEKGNQVIDEKTGKPKEEKESLIIDGYCTLCGGRQVGAGRTGAGARLYTLADVEQIAHSMAYNRAIDVEQLKRALTLVRAEAVVWGYLDPL